MQLYFFRQVNQYHKQKNYNLVCIESVMLSSWMYRYPALCKIEKKKINLSESLKKNQMKLKAFCIWKLMAFKKDEELWSLKTLLTSWHL